MVWICFRRAVDASHRILVLRHVSVSALGSQFDRSRRALDHRWNPPSSLMAKAIHFGGDVLSDYDQFLLGALCAIAIKAQRIPWIAFLPIASSVVF